MSPLPKGKAMDDSCLREIVAKMPSAVLVWSVSTGGKRSVALLYSNERAEQQWAHPFASHVGEEFEAFESCFQDTAREIDLRGRLQAVAQSGEREVLKDVHICRDARMPLSLHVHLIPLGGGCVAMATESPFRDLLEASSDVFLVANERGEVLYQSPSYDTVSGYEPGELYGLDPTTLVDDESKLAIQQALEKLVCRPGESETIELRRRHRDGSWRDMELVARNLLDDPDVRGIVVNSRDITRRKEAERKAEQLNQDLEAFSYTVSHDLRTPIRIISEYCQALLEGEGDLLAESSRRRLEMILETSRQMSRLTTDLLSFSRLGDHSVAREAVDLAGISRELIEEWREAGMTEGVTFAISSPLPCHGDPGLLRQVMANLLSNALKFSRPRTRPEVQVGRMQDRCGGVFYVRDNGVGFDMTADASPFTVFQRLHEVDTFEGSGVGLASVKRIVERHGGRVWAESAPDQGATFYFTLAGEG